VVNDKCHRFLLDGLASKDPFLEEESRLGKPIGILRELRSKPNSTSAVYIDHQEENFSGVLTPETDFFWKGASFNPCMALWEKPI
jgi:hypothetical protein